MTLFKPALSAVLLGATSLAMAQTPQLLILGTAHLNNPGHDLNNIPVDDVLTPKRQSEIEQIVDQLMHFNPTRVALECTPDQQADYDQRYAQYLSGTYKLSRNERDQIGMRVAAKLKLTHVDCVDYQAGAPGPKADYDFVTFAQTHAEQIPAMQEMMAVGKNIVAEETSFLQSHSLINWYRRANQASKRSAENALYMRFIAKIGDAETHPGANWIGAWHSRNMIIVNNLRRIAKPGDRVFTLFGSGHGFLLNEFAIESGAFELVDTESYLR